MRRLREPPLLLFRRPVFHVRDMDVIEAGKGGAKTKAGTDTKDPFFSFLSFEECMLCAVDVWGLGGGCV